MLLYHATKETKLESAISIAEKIEEEGFSGSVVWGLENVVFLADKPLTGFGGWSDAWVVVDVPDEVLTLGMYDDKEYDDYQYQAQCYAFDVDLINRYQRRATDRAARPDEWSDPNLD